MSDQKSISPSYKSISAIYADNYKGWKWVLLILSSIAIIMLILNLADNENYKWYSSIALVFIFIIGSIIGIVFLRSPGKTKIKDVWNFN
jgi:hypothetical protein